MVMQITEEKKPEKKFIDKVAVDMNVVKKNMGSTWHDEDEFVKAFKIKSKSAERQSKGKFRHKGGIIGLLDDRFISRVQPQELGIMTKFLFGLFMVVIIPILIGFGVSLLFEGGLDFFIILALVISFGWQVLKYMRYKMKRKSD